MRHSQVKQCEEVPILCELCRTFRSEQHLLLVSLYRLFYFEFVFSILTKVTSKFSDLEFYDYLVD